MSRHAIRWRSWSVLTIAVVCASLATALLAFARVQAAEEPDEVSLDDTRQQLTAIEQELADARNDRRLLDLREETLALQSQIRNASARIEPQLAQIKARIEELGAAPQGAKEPADLAAQRRELEHERSSLEGQLKLAGLLSLQADQIVTQISARSREQLRQRVGDRTSSPLGPKFWVDLRAEAPQDLRRLGTFASEVMAALRGSSFIAWIGALILTVVTFAARRWLAEMLLRFAPAGRLHRSLRALIDVVLWTLSASIIASAILFPLSSSDAPAPRLAALLPGVVFAAVLGTYVAALGSALTAAHVPTWRVPALANEVAVRLRRYGFRLAIVIAFVSLIEQLISVTDLSLKMSMALDGFMTFILGITLARGLRRGVQAQAAASRGSRNDAESEKAAVPLWAAIIVGIGWILLVGGALCVLLGYIALGSFVVKLAAWDLVVLCTAYLLAVVVDDVLMALFTATRAKVSRDPAIGVRSPAAVLLSALARLTIGLFALALLVAPVGAGAIDLLPSIHRLQQGISIGAVQLRPGAVGRGILILVLGVGAMNVIRRWTEQRYLPVTSMDAGMRATVTSLISYVGYGIVIAFALSAMGVGLRQITWVASALALGIGFGLQAIVQNFVSGLILMAERPVKVGDWVVLNEFEGDVRRIKARATEIQRRDRSTIIVPNSELITKVVRNVTYANPFGLVQIRLPMRLGTDVERVRTELLQAFRAHADILRTPEPSVILEAIEGGNILFNATGFVSSPRVVESVRSAVLFDALSRLKEAGIQ